MDLNVTRQQLHICPGYDLTRDESKPDCSMEGLPVELHRVGINGRYR